MYITECTVCKSKINRRGWHILIMHRSVFTHWWVPRWCRRWWDNWSVGTATWKIKHTSNGWRARLTRVIPFHVRLVIWKFTMSTSLRLNHQTLITGRPRCHASRRRRRCCRKSSQQWCKFLFLLYLTFAAAACQLTIHLCHKFTHTASNASQECSTM